MFKDVLQEILEAEHEDDLGYSMYGEQNKTIGNSRTGHFKKTVKSDLGEIALSIPRDRNFEFEPKLVLSISEICQVLKRK